MPLLVKVFFLGCSVSIMKYIAVECVLVIHGKGARLVAVMTAVSVPAMLIWVRPYS